MEKEVQQQEESVQDVFRRHAEELHAEAKDKASILDLINAEKGRSVCETEAQAAMIARGWATLEHEKLRVKEQYDRRLKQISARQKSFKYLFEYALEEWTQRNLKGKKKSLVLPDATVGFRKVNGSVKTESMDKLRQWASVELPQAVNYDRAPVMVDPVKEWEKKNEILAPGRIETPDDNRFYVKVPRPDDRKELGEGEEDA